jgi:hypothetical protein
LLATEKKSRKKTMPQTSYTYTRRSKIKVTLEENAALKEASEVTDHQSFFIEITNNEHIMIRERR